jgi:hypothetical protein
MIVVPRRGYRGRIADTPKKPSGGKPKTGGGEPKGGAAKKPAAGKSAKAAPGQPKKPAAAKPKPAGATAAKPAAPDGKSRGFKVPRLGALIAGAIVVALVAWLIFHDSGGSSSTSSSGESAKPGEPQAATAASLQETAAKLGSPIYWAGPQNDSELEVTESEGGERVYVRYLTGGAEIGDPRPDFLTVGSYAFEDPVKALKRQSKQPGGELSTAPGGATVYVNSGRPQSVYVAYPGVEVEIEVYDPDPKKARDLVSSGQIVPVG